MASGYVAFEEIQEWFKAKGIEAGNPESIHDEFSAKQKESLRKINKDGQRNLQSSTLLGKRKINKMNLSSLTITL